MVGRRRHLLPRGLPPSWAAALLLFAWIAGFAAPCFHDHADHAPAAGDSALDRHDTADHDHAADQCAGVVRDVPTETSIAAHCPAGDNCRDPFHHHHSHDRVRAVVGCAICAALLVREALPIVGFALPSPAATLLVRLPPHRSSASECAVVAQARGPPGVGVATSRHDRPSTTALSRA